MSQVELNLTKGLELKEEGQARVKSKDYGWLEEARTVARGIIAEQGQVTSDEILARIGKPIGVHHNLIGTIFQTPEFRRVGFCQTKRPEGHARMIGVWISAS